MFHLSTAILNGLNQVTLVRFYYTGNPETHMVRSITWTKDGMAYSLFFLEQVKEADAEFYKEHVVPLKSIDSLVMN